MKLTQRQLKEVIRDVIEEEYSYTADPPRQKSTFDMERTEDTGSVVALENRISELVSAQVDAIKRHDFAALSKIVDELADVQAQWAELAL